LYNEEVRRRGSKDSELRQLFGVWPKKGGREMEKELKRDV
jgi:hypothetical protein